MFENLKITSGVDGDRLVINLQWKWKYLTGGEIPSCEVFCCTIPENELLHDSIFSQEEIIKWIVNRKGIDIYSPATRIDNLNAYYSNPINKVHCRKNRYSLNNGGKLTSVQRMDYPLSDVDKIFFMCVYGSKTFESKVFAINTQEDSIPYDIVTQRKFTWPFGSGEKILKLKSSDKRRRVLVSRYGDGEVYSILPNGNELYLGKNIVPENIIKIVYLSSLIGN